MQQNTPACHSEHQRQPIDQIINQSFKNTFFIYQSYMYIQHVLHALELIKNEKSRTFAYALILDPTETTETN